MSDAERAFTSPRRRLVGDSVTYAIAIAVATAVSALFVLAMRGDVLVAFRTIVTSSLGSFGGVAQTLNKICPLLLGGMAVMLGLRGGLFNLGVDGQMYVGAIIATGVAFAAAGLNLPAVVFIPVFLLAALLGGAAFAAVPALLRARWSVNEIFVTVMLNFVGYYLAQYLTTGPWQDTVVGEAMTHPIPDAATLPMLNRETGAHSGIVLSVVTSVAVCLLLTRTVLGYKIRAVGDNPRAAWIGGISIARITIITLSLSGGMAGLAGGIEVAGYHARLILGLTPGYGAMAILIAVLGKTHPVGVGIAAVMVAILMVGSDSLQRSVGLPASAGLVFQAIVVLCVLFVEARAARRSHPA